MVATRRGRGGIGDAGKEAATKAATDKRGRTKAVMSTAGGVQTRTAINKPVNNKVASGGSGKSGSGGNAAATSTGREELKNPGEYEYETMEKFRGRLSLNSRVKWVEEIELSLTPGLC